MYQYIECFEWQYDQHSKPSYSEIWLYTTPDKKILVIAAEPGNDYKGMSITNGVERVATEVTRRLGIQFDYFVEYYPPGPGRSIESAETFDLVRFKKAEGMRASYHGFIWDDPDWRRITRAEIEAIVGQPVLKFEVSR